MQRNMNPEIQVAFTTAEKWEQKQQNQHILKVEKLRSRVQQKQASIADVLTMEQHALCQYFEEYSPINEMKIGWQQMCKSEKLKLIRNNGRIYFGEVVNRKMSGQGVCIYEEGKIYEGRFVDNKKEGKGTQIYEGGNLYIGDYFNNKKHGNGQFYWFEFLNQQNREIHLQFYDGEWWGGLPDGRGTMQKLNGDFYQGTFKNGVKHGFGSENFHNGDHYKGQYVNGLPEGLGQYNWNEEERYNGDFKQGLRNGYGCWKKIGDKNICESYIGNYLMDKKNGYGEYDWGNGWCYKGNFQNDYRQGYGQLLKANKIIYRGQWRKGDKCPHQIPSDKIKISRMQLKHQLMSKNEVQVQGLLISLNYKQNSSVSKEHELLARPCLKAIKATTNKKLRTSSVLGSTGYETLKDSRVGINIQRPISKAFSIKSSRNLKVSGAI